MPSLSNSVLHSKGQWSGRDPRQKGRKWEAKQLLQRREKETPPCVQQAKPCALRAEGTVKSNTLNITLRSSLTPHLGFVVVMQLHLRPRHHTQAVSQSEDKFLSRSKQLLRLLAVKKSYRWRFCSREDGGITCFTRKL